MPSPVDKYHKQVLKDNPSYSDEQAWATAWSIYCKHKNPDSKSCHQGEYLKGRSASDLTPERAFRDALVVRNVIDRVVVANDDASAEASKSEARAKETDRLYESMQSLKMKVDNAEKSAQKKFDRAYDKMFSNGEAAAKAAEKLVQKLDSKVEEDSQPWFALTLLERSAGDWERNKFDHLRAKGSLGYLKLRQAEQTWGYAMQMEEKIQMLSKALKGEYDE